MPLLVRPPLHSSAPTHFLEGGWAQPEHLRRLFAWEMRHAVENRAVHKNCPASRRNLRRRAFALTRFNLGKGGCESRLCCEVNSAGRIVELERRYFVAPHGRPERRHDVSGTCRVRVVGCGSGVGVRRDRRAWQGRSVTMMRERFPRVSFMELME
ncbi:hypothetical protein T484DRAFT_1750702 [Baffinella frigidus]|nr:hypothetical protein T484DRAFT_1750702 [Cryptophyta sp. CCMP2293]